jgi:hypothetical protein
MVVYNYMCYDFGGHLGLGCNTIRRLWRFGECKGLECISWLLDLGICSDTTIQSMIYMGNDLDRAEFPLVASFPYEYSVL